MNNRTYLIIATVAIALTLASCSSNTNQSGSGLYIGGTNGLIMSFQASAPPDTVQDNGQTPMPIILNVQNAGEFDTQNVIFHVSGLSPSDFVGLEPTIVHKGMIRGATKLSGQVVPGEQEIVQLANDTVVYQRSLKGGGSLDFPMTIDACYGYATLGTATVCVKPDYYAGTGTGCDPTVSSLDVSGAPVQISGLQTQAVGKNRLMMSFKVAKETNAAIWDPTNGQDCSATSIGQRQNQADWVYVQVDGGSVAQSMQCTSLIKNHQSDGPAVLAYDQQYFGPTGHSIDAGSLNLASGDAGYVRLSGGSSTVTCYLNLKPGVSDSESTVDIALAYFVDDTVTKTITVQHAP